MYDSVDVAQIPDSAMAAAGYVNGRYANIAELRDRFPGARILSIAVTADADADCLDIERFDAVPGDAPGWYARQKARGVARPCLYASASLMQSAVLPVLEAAGIPRSEVRLWSAHYGAGQHRCGPASCRLMSIEADGTQFDDRALGRDLDQSLLVADFFGAVPQPDPVPAWQEAIMNALPVLRQGATGADVRTVQALCVARGHATKVDGAFGPATALSVSAVQRNHGLAADQIVGPLTWKALLAV